MAENTKISELAGSFPEEFAGDPHRFDTPTQEQRPVAALSGNGIDPSFVLGVAQAVENGADSEEARTRAGLVLGGLEGWSRYMATQERRGEPATSLQEFLRIRGETGYRPEETNAVAGWLARVKRPDGRQASDYEVAAAGILKLDGRRQPQ